MNELKEVLQALKELGKITDEDIKQVEWASEKNRKVVDTLHLLICRKNHDTDCNYLKEQVLADCWTSTAHQLWLEESDAICKKLGVGGNPAEALNLIERATAITRDFTEPSIYLALSVLQPKLLEVLPIDFSLVKPLPALGDGSVPALPPDRDIEAALEKIDEHNSGKK